MYFLKESYAQNLVEISDVKTSDSGLSSVDKVLMTQSKIDEGIVALEDINIKLTIKRLDEMYDVDITEEEIDYYVKNYSPSNMQINLIFAYFAKYFGAYRPLNMLNKRDFVKLALILKKQLLLNSGFDEGDKNKIQCSSLPYVLTGNLYDKVNLRNIRNNNFTSKIDINYMYNKLTNPIDGKYRYLESFKPDFIKSILSGFVNTRFTYCSYDHPEREGDEIIYSEDKICDEILMLLNNVLVFKIELLPFVQ